MASPVVCMRVGRLVVPPRPGKPVGRTFLSALASEAMGRNDLFPTNLSALPAPSLHFAIKGRSKRRVDDEESLFLFQGDSESGSVVANFVRV